MGESLRLTMYTSPGMVDIVNLKEVRYAHSSYNGRSRRSRL